jgi:hypothetical protein
MLQSVSVASWVRERAGEGNLFAGKVYARVASMASNISDINDAFYEICRAGTGIPDTIEECLECVVALAIFWDASTSKPKSNVTLKGVEDALAELAQSTSASSAAHSDTETIVPDNESNATVVRDSSGLPELLKEFVDKLIEEVRPLTCYKVVEILRSRCGETANVKSVFSEINQLYKREKEGSTPLNYITIVKNLLKSEFGGCVFKDAVQWNKLFAEAAKADGLCVASKNKGSVPVFSTSNSEKALINATRAAALEVLILYIEEVDIGEINRQTLLTHLLKLITSVEQHIFRGLVMLIEGKARLTPNTNYTRNKPLVGAHFFRQFAEPYPAEPENEAGAEAETKVIFGIRQNANSAGTAFEMNETAFKKEVDKSNTSTLMQVLITHLMLANWPKDEFVKAMQKIFGAYATPNTISMGLVKDLLPNFECIATDLPKFVAAVQKSAMASASAPAPASVFSVENIQRAANPLNLGKNFKAGLNHMLNRSPTPQDESGADESGADESDAPGASPSNKSAEADNTLGWESDDDGDFFKNDDENDKTIAK